MFCLFWSSTIWSNQVPTNIQHITNPYVSGKPPGPFLARLMDVKGTNSHVIKYFHITAASLTVLFMIGSDIFVRFSHRSEPTLANAPTAIVNTIPFSNLNTSISLTIGLNIILSMFGVTLVMGVHATLILATLLVTNKSARKHLRLRLKQKFDSLSIGRNNNHLLRLRHNLEALSIGRSGQVEPVVSIALVPIRDFWGIQ